MQFEELETEDQLKTLKDDKGYIIIFKYNTTCPISRSVKRKFEMDVNNLPESGKLYSLDILNHRDLSDLLANEYEITHESPQILVFKNGKAIYHESHFNISVEETANAISQNNN